MAKSVKGTRTEINLKEAFAGESQANRRYLYFANMADVAGAPDVASVFRSTAEGETGHAHGHMEYLINGGAGEPGTGMSAKTVAEALKLPSMVRHMSIATCILAWPKKHATKDLTKSLTGLRL